MAMSNVRRIAAEVLNVGESKVKFKNDSLSKIEEALTREDVRTLIKDGDVFAIAPRGVSRVRARAKQAQKKKGRRSGRGSRKGTFTTRGGGKNAWMSKVRAQRKHLRALLESGALPQESSRKIYLMVKGNAFKGVKVLDTYLRDNKLIGAEAQIAPRKRQKAPAEKKMSNAQAPDNSRAKPEKQ